MTGKQFIVIGLGRFGGSVARTLYSLGNDVLAIDNDENVVQEISDSVTQAIVADVTEENMIKTFGIRNFDVAIIAIGSNIQNSVMATLIAKEQGVKYVVAKAQDEMHGRILHRIGADKVIFPERDMGARVANNLCTSNILDYIELSPLYSIVEISALKEWENKTLAQANVRDKYGITIMAIKDGDEINVSPKTHDIIKPGDTLVVVGTNEDLRKVERVRTTK